MTNRVFDVDPNGEESVEVTTLFGVRFVLKDSYHRPFLQN